MAQKKKNQKKKASQKRALERRHSEGSESEKHDLDEKVSSLVTFDNKFNEKTNKRTNSSGGAEKLTIRILGHDLHLRTLARVNDKFWWVVVIGRAECSLIFITTK